MDGKDKVTEKKCGRMMETYCKREKGEQMEGTECNRKNGGVLKGWSTGDEGLL